MEDTYERLVLTAVIHANLRFAGLVENLEWKVLEIGLNFRVLVFPTNELQRRQGTTAHPSCL
jgi:hypothetical protein